METVELNSPIDVMLLLHKALRVEAKRVEKALDQMEIGGSLQPFRTAFNSWATALEYHAMAEDQHMTSLLKDALPARDNREQHRALEKRIEEVLSCLNEEIGRTRVIPRTHRHLFGCIVALRIAQDDHLEEEEAFVLPLVRQQADGKRQAEMVKHLLFDDEAEDHGWVLDWIAERLTPQERTQLRALAAKCAQLA